MLLTRAAGLGDIGGVFGVDDPRWAGVTGPLPHKEIELVGALPEELGAFVNIACHPDLATARSMVRGGLTTFARFSVMHGATAGPLDESQRSVLGALHDRYDMNKHTRGDSQQAVAR